MPLKNDNPLLKSGACVKRGAKRHTETRGQLWKLGHSLGTVGKTKSNAGMHKSKYLESANAKQRVKGPLFTAAFPFVLTLKEE